MICNICNIECKSLGNHLYFNHNLSSKQYYDIYLKKPDEGYCRVCKKPTIFKGLTRGYGKYCSCTCTGKGSHSSFQEYYEDGFGNKFESLSKLCQYHNISESTLTLRLKDGWNIFDAIITPNQHKIKINYNNIQYDSLKEACRKLNLNYNFICELLRNGKTFEEAVNTQKIYLRGYVYNNKQYKTLTELCNDYNLNWNKMYGILHKGCSIEEAIMIYNNTKDIVVQSYPEEIIFSYLLDNNINVNRQISIKKIKINNNIIDNSYSNKLLFDFYFIYNDIVHCIEYDGELHFDKNALLGYIQRKSNKILDSQTINNIFLNYRNNDIQKTNFCKKYKIKLLRIHYSQQSNISQLIDIFINSDYTDRFNPYISNIDYYKEII